MPRARSATILTCAFGLFSLAHLVQVVLGMTPTSGEPLALVIEHAVAFLTAVSAAVAIWRGSRTAPWLVLGWGVVIACLLGSLPLVIDIPREGRMGIWVSGAGVLAMAIVISRFLYRRQQTV